MPDRSDLPSNIFKQPGEEEPGKKEQTDDKLEQYLKKIEEGKSDPVVSEIVSAQGEYLDQRVNLKDDQGEEIKQLAIKFIKQLSKVDLEKLVSNPHLIASIYERDEDEGLGCGESMKRTRGTRYKESSPYTPHEVNSKAILLAYATKELGEIQEQFLQEYLDGGNGEQHLHEKKEDARVVIHEGDKKLEKVFRQTVPAFLKYHDQYKQAWQRAEKLRLSAPEFKRMTSDPENQNSPAISKARGVGSFYGDWINGVQIFFPIQPSRDGLKKMKIPILTDDWWHNDYFQINSPYQFTLKEVDDQGVIHLEEKKVSED